MGCCGSTPSTASCRRHVVSLRARVQPKTPLDVYKVVYLKGENAAFISPTVVLLTMTVRLETVRVFCNGRKVPVPARMMYENGANQYVVDFAQVENGCFIGDTASQEVENYKRGTTQLVSQFAVHNRFTFPYEIGNEVSEPNAGVSGISGCLQGIHVFASRDAALKYAQLMGLHSDGGPITDGVVYGGEAMEQVAPWWPWNRYMGIVADGCAACGFRPAIASPATVGKCRLMGCGHVVCATCRPFISDAGNCPACHERFTRIADSVWAF